MLLRTTPATLAPVAFAAFAALASLTPGPVQGPRPCPPPILRARTSSPGVVVAAAATGEATQGVRTYKIRRV